MKDLKNTKAYDVTRNPRDATHLKSKASSLLSEAIWGSVGIHDYARPKEDKESFYHDFLLGMLLAQNEDGAYEIVSNKESGLGYMDIAIADHINRRGIIIEIKVGDTMDDLAKQVYTQIAEKDYRSYFPQDYRLIDYAAVFYKKPCRICLLGKKG